jgi:hypothetical protein
VDSRPGLDALELKYPLKQTELRLLIFHPFCTLRFFSFLRVEKKKTPEIRIKQRKFVYFKSLVINNEVKFSLRLTKHHSVNTSGRS